METLSEGIGTAIETLAKKLDIEPKAMREGVERIMKEKAVPDATALAQWKRNNRGLFASKNYEFVTFGKTAVKTIPVMNKKTEEKEDRNVSNVDIIVKTETGLKVYVISLWGEAADAVDAIEIGTKYKGRLSLGSKGFASLISPKGKLELKKLKESTVPDLKDIIPKLKTEDISAATDKVGEYGFFKGVITRIGEKGIELDSTTSLPVQCWISDILGDIPEFEEGQSAIAFGRPYINKKGETHISAHAIYKA